MATAPNNVTPLKPQATLAASMALAFAEIDGATKAATGQVGQQKYKYADLTAVIEAIKPALIAHNLFFTQRPQPSEGGVTIETVIGHASGEEMSLGTLFVPANKSDAAGAQWSRPWSLLTLGERPMNDNGASRPRRDTTITPKVI